MGGFEDKLMDARTVAFISLVFSENVRSYTSRSFDQPAWRNLLGNVQMQKAIVMAQLCLVGSLYIPVFSDLVLGLRGVSIGIWGWLFALVGPVAVLILCELSKLITSMQMEAHQRNLDRKTAVVECSEAA